jgi:hypothetical protein
VQINNPLAGAAEFLASRQGEISRLLQASTGINMAKIYATDVGHLAARASEILSTASAAAMQRLQPYQFPDASQISAIMNFPSRSALAAQLGISQEVINQHLSSPLYQAIRDHRSGWTALLIRLADYGIREEDLEAILPDPLDALTSAQRVIQAAELVDALSRVQRLWPAGDDKGRRQVLRLLGRARSELRSARTDAKAARFEPGRRGRRMPVPDMDRSWLEVTERYPEWRNPVKWPWLGDRAADVAGFLASHIAPRRGTGRRKAGKSLGRVYSNDVLELTAEVLNQRYSQFLFHDLHFTPTIVKARVTKRKLAKTLRSR